VKHLKSHFPTPRNLQSDSQNLAHTDNNSKQQPAQPELDRTQHDISIYYLVDIIYRWRAGTEL